MISYAQNHEDVLLHRALGKVAEGVYIDVGAGDPTVDSVTRWFYDRGWHGLNIEPRPRELAMLTKERPRDINLNSGISDRPGTSPFFIIEAPIHGLGDPGGLSTFDTELAERYRAEKTFHVEEVPRDVITLAAALKQYDFREADFLKVDVEGWEEKVLRGMDWDFCRPRVAVVEGTVPTTSKPAHESWESILLEQDYSFVLFDGLNRFYVRNEDAALKEFMQVPVNVLDGYTSHYNSKVQEEFVKAVSATDPGSLRVGLWFARRTCQLKKLLRVA